MGEYPIPSNLNKFYERIAAAEGRVAELEAENKELHDRMDALRIWAVLLDAELPTDFEPSLATEERIAAFAKKYEELEHEIQFNRLVQIGDLQVINALREENARLKAPVSDEEMASIWFHGRKDFFAQIMASRAAAKEGGKRGRK